MPFELSGTIKDLSLDFRTSNAILTLSINERHDATVLFDELHDAEKLSIKIDKYREKRSLNANSYFWLLCNELAGALSDEKVKYTKEDIYRKIIKESGVYKDWEGVSPTDAKTLRTAWEMLGTGWITEQVDYMPDGENVIVRTYYGSSQYNTKQMSRLIDNIVQDCQAAGINTKTPDEIANLLSLWGEEKCKNKS